MAYKALELMAAKNIGALPVVNSEAGDKLIGIFSERDSAQGDPEGQVLAGDPRERADEQPGNLRQP